MIWSGFLGPSGKSASRNVSGEQTRNLYLEAVSTGSPKTPLALYGRPGLQPFNGLYQGPVRAMLEQDGRAWAIGGGLLHEIFASQQTPIIRGAVALDGLPATMSANGEAGQQVLVTSGGFVYILATDTNAFTQVHGPWEPRLILSGTFYRGYFFVLDDTGAAWFSTPDNGLLWDGLDFIEESNFPERVVAMAAIHDQLWLWGTQHIDTWYSAGGLANPFLPIPGTIFQVGTAAPFSATPIFNTAIWVGQNDDGSYIVYLANGGQPSRISTHAVEFALAGVSADQLRAAQGWTFEYRGHTFYSLTIPGLTTTWVYDLLTQEWVEWALWDARQMNWRPFLAQNHIFAFGKHLFGDRQSSGIYALDPAYLTDIVFLAA
jgi:hypothetical protein